MSETAAEGGERVVCAHPAVALSSEAQECVDRATLLPVAATVVAHLVVADDVCVV